ncbi:hypothetical protein BH20ACT5_BH20ACT5_09060 [soil metagenome]
MSDHAVVYYKPGCPFGIRLRVSLRFKGIPYQPVRFRDDEDGAAKVRELNHGNEISPTVRIGRRYFTNPTAAEVLRVLTE